MTNHEKIRFENSVWSELGAAILFVLFAAMLASYIPLSAAQGQQRTFQSAEEASLALFTAAQQENERVLLDILGPAGKEVVSSGDPIEDMDHRVGFVVKYKQMHRLAKEPDGAMTLYVGAENWPFPIPLVSKNGVWFFDTDAGKEEILLRRIGKNELAAIDACQHLVDAEQEYYKKPFDGQPHYTERFVSDKGKHNGLYWSDAEDEFRSPVDPLIASAGQENTESGDDAPTADPIPFNGYYFRVLKGQGENAQGGAKSYLVDRKMVAGFAFVAYPAKYRSSGVMTFIVNQDGTIYQKDLGADTSKLAASMTEYNPDSTWRRVD